MPRRHKKSTATKPKGSKSGISINIKNIMRQVQNERPTRQDFINLTGKKPMDNLNTGNMSLLTSPAMLYASRPLSQFPSLASISNIDRGFAPPLSQISNFQSPTRPDILKVETNPNDIGQSKPSVKAIASNPVVPPVAVSGYNPTVAEITAPVERYLVPAGIPSNLVSAYDGKEDELTDESQRLVAQQMDEEARQQYYLEQMREVEQMRAEMGLPPTPWAPRGRGGRGGGRGRKGRGVYSPEPPARAAATTPPARNP